MKKTTLPNGLRILTEQTPWRKSASMGVWIACGSRYETPENAGAAHFIEHMLFKGTINKTAKQIAEETDSIGGALNAFTAKEYTCVHTHALTEHVNTAFETIAQMLTVPLFSPTDIELEKGVIIEEINMYEDSPEDLCLDTLYSHIWRGMLGSNILGTVQTVSAATRKTLLTFKEKMYVPERMVVSICGNFDEESFLQLCEKYFAGLKNTSFPLQSTPEPFESGLIRKKKDFEQTQLCVGFPGPPLESSEKYCLSLLLNILGSSSSSRLYQRLREELGLVYSVDAFSAGHIGNGFVGINAAVSRKSEKQAIEEIFRVLEEFKKGVTEKELLRAKNSYRSSLLMGMESSGAVASHMASSELLQNKILPIDEISQKISGVTLEQICTLSERLFDRSKMALCAVGKVQNSAFYNGLF